MKDNKLCWTNGDRIHYTEEYWSDKTNWIDIKPKMKLNLHTYDSYEEYRKMRKEVREIMELNMVLYGKW